MTRNFGLKPRDMKEWEATVTNFGIPPQIPIDVPDYREPDEHKAWRAISAVIVSMALGAIVGSCLTFWIVMAVT